MSFYATLEGKIGSRRFGTNQLKLNTNFTKILIDIDLTDGKSLEKVTPKFPQNYFEWDEYVKYNSTDGKDLKNNFGKDHIFKNLIDYVDKTEYDKVGFYIRFADSVQFTVFETEDVEDNADNQDAERKIPMNDPNSKGDPCDVVLEPPRPRAHVKMKCFIDVNAFTELNGMWFYYADGNDSEPKIFMQKRSFSFDPCEGSVPMGSVGG